MQLLGKIMIYCCQAPAKKRKPPQQRNLPESGTVSSTVEVSTMSLAANSMDCESDASFQAAAVVKQVLCLLSAFA